MVGQNEPLDALEGYYRRGTLYTLYRNQGVRYPLSQAKFTREIIRFVGGTDAGDRKEGTARLLSLPTLEEGRVAFRKNTQIIHDVFMEGAPSDA